jgi:hypothetical protein
MSHEIHAVFGSYIRIVTHHWPYLVCKGPDGVVVEPGTEGWVTTRVFPGGGPAGTVAGCFAVFQVAVFGQAVAAMVGDGWL